MAEAPAARREPALPPDAAMWVREVGESLEQALRRLDAGARGLQDR
jgi:hypothetical protein